MDTPSQQAPDLGLLQTLAADGSLVDANATVPDDATLRGMHELMLKMRRLDERMMLRQRQGKIGFYGAVTGQEATPVATTFATRPSDWIFPALRENAVMLGRGFPLTKWLAQVYGNSGDVLKGRQMPSHMSGREVNQVSWGSCLGPQLPQAVGAALAAKRRGDDMVSIAFLGDGTTSEPDFHTAMNFAGVMKAPCVIICQNNHWAISVPSQKQTAAQTFAVKARAYGMPGLRVDGNDVLALYGVLSDAVERARQGGGPSFIEAVTYRIGAHSSSDDPTRYRSDEEVETWKKRDPLLRLEAYLTQRGLLDDHTRASLAEAWDQEISEAIAAVEGLAPPSRESLFEDVYAELPDGRLPWHLEEQRDESLALADAPKHD